MGSAAEAEAGWNLSTYKLCKRLCYLLRHATRRDLPMRRDGYVSAHSLLLQNELAGIQWSQILYVIRTNYKQRFGIAIREHCSPQDQQNSVIINIPRRSRVPSTSTGQPACLAKNVMGGSPRISWGHTTLKVIPPSHPSTPPARQSTSPPEEHEDFSSGVACVIPRRHTELSERQIPIKRHDKFKTLLGPSTNRQCSEENLVRGQFECDTRELSSDDDDTAVNNASNPKKCEATPEPSDADSSRPTTPPLLSLKTIKDLWDPRLDLDYDRQQPHSRGDDENTFGKLTLSDIWVRAHQGHSNHIVDPRLSCLIVCDPKKEISLCIHGTTHAAWKSIRRQGLSKMKRSHIHFASQLPPDLYFKASLAESLGQSPSRQQTHVISGIRKNSEIAIYVDAEKCFNDGIEFYIAHNGVILSPGDSSGFIKPKYFQKILDLQSGELIT